MKKKIITTICVLTLTLGLSSSTMATPLITGLNSTNRISFVGTDDTAGTDDDIVFDAGDFEVINNRIDSNIDLMKDNIVNKGGTVSDDMVDSINSIPNILGIEYITATGDVQYTYHHHTLSSTSNDSTDPTPGSIADNYSQGSSAGCCRTPIYHTHTNACRCNGTLVYYHVKTYDGGDYEPDHWAAGLRCSRCGQNYGEAINTSGYVGDGYWGYREHAENGDTIPNGCSANKCGKNGSTIDGYKIGCGKREGQIVSADIVFND